MYSGLAQHCRVDAIRVKRGVSEQPRGCSAQKTIPRACRLSQGGHVVPGIDQSTGEVAVMGHAVCGARIARRAGLSLFGA